MTLPKEGIEIVQRNMESYSYEDLKSLGDQYIYQCYNGLVSSFDDEIAAMYFIEIRRREKEMSLFELIKKRSRWLLSKMYSRLKIK